MLNPIVLTYLVSKGREFSKIPMMIVKCKFSSVNNLLLNPRKKMRWAVNLYSEWRRSRISYVGCADEIVKANLELLHSFDQREMCYSLSRFIREIRRLDGKEYPPNTLREIVICIQMFLHENMILWKLLDHPQFVALRNVLDNTMKERHREGLGVRQSAEIITLSHENRMFETGVLGTDAPDQLLNTVIYVVGMHFALRGGVEHNNLRLPGKGNNSQVTFRKDSKGIESVVYQEDPCQKK